MKKELLPKLPVVRAEVRQYVEYRQSLIKAAIDRGENPYQLTLDMQDVVNEIMRDWHEDDAVAYLNMLTEETNAMTNRINDQTNAIYQGQINDAVNESMAAQWIIAIVFAVFMLFIMLR